MTGSFFAAIPEGTSPAITVNSMLITINIIAPETGNDAFKLLIPVNWNKIILMIMLNINVRPMPMIPATNPTIKVSALKTLEISVLEAPMDLNIPISLVRSSTEI